MKIAMVTPGLTNKTAGIKVFVEHLSNELILRETGLEILGLADQDWCAGGNRDWEGPPANACRIRGPGNFGYSPELSQRLYQIEAGITHLNGLWMFPAWATLQWHRRTGRPYCYSIHGMLSPSALSYSKLKKCIAKAAFQLTALEQAGCLHVTSEAELSDCRNYGLKNAIALISPGMKAQSIPDVEKSKIVLFLGRMHPIKGLEALIKAWATAARTDWTLRLAGPGEASYVASLKQQVKALQLTNVEFIDPVYGAARDRLMAESAMTVLPSASENFGMVVAESLMMGTPVIASTGTPWQGLIKHQCGAWVPQNELSETIARLTLLEMEELQQMGQRGRSWILDEMNWSNITDKFLTTYRWLLQEADQPDWLILD
ncbi:MAG: glycosyltransferase [Proteobacteria bacterium]|nr:glycosyltransferase [Pseudomonadota bacterium]